MSSLMKKNSSNIVDTNTDVCEQNNNLFSLLADTDGYEPISFIRALFRGTDKQLYKPDETFTSDYLYKPEESFTSADYKPEESFTSIDDYEPKSFIRDLFTCNCHHLHKPEETLTNMDDYIYNPEETLTNTDDYEFILFIKSLLNIMDN